MRFFFNPLSGQVNAGPPREIVYADTAPQYPLEGSRWFDTINLREYVYDGAAWVETGVGPAGVKGDTGEKGDKGDIGNVGPVGPQGPAATIAVGTVTTGAAGTSASVSNSGNSGAAVFDFTIPQGAKGDTGNIGPQGPQGIQGVKGDDGASISLKGAVTSPADLTSIAVKVEGDLYVAQSDGNGYVWDGSAWVDVGQIRGPKGDTGAQGPAGPAPAGTGAVVVSNGVVGTPVGYGTANVANTLVQRDASGNFSAGTITGTFSGNVTGGVTGNVTGNASTASKLATAQTINVSGDVTGTAQSFDGSAAITIPTAISAGVIVNADINAAAAISDTKLATISTAGKVSNSATTATSANTNSAIVARDTNGNFSATTITAALSGNATTASSAAKLTTARNINGVSFDGSADISINNFGNATASYLTVSPQDAVNEGGEIALRGAGSFSDFRIDNFQGNARIHTLAAGKRLEILGGSIYANGTADNYFQGSVGIGTTTPGGKLHVHGGPNDDSTADLYVTGSGGWTAVHNNSSQGAWNPLVNAGDKSVIFSGGTAGTGNLVVAPWSGSSNGVKINQDGVVLIGTSSPSNSGWSSQKIEAFGGSVMSRTDTSEGGRLELLNLTKTGTDVSNWSLYNMTGAYQKGLHFWRYQANGGNPGTSMFLSDGGNVGIGTTTPGARLHVSGDIIATTLNGNVAGTNTVNKSFQSSNSVIANGSGSLNTLEVLGTPYPGGAAMMTFHRPGYFAGYFGIDTDNQFKVGGWSFGANSYTLLHSGNFSSYAQPALGFTPVQQGGGTGQSNNKIYIGWSGSQLQLQVDNTNFGANWPINVAGAGIPAGAVMPFAMTSVPTGWLAANGAAVSRATYSGLFTAIGTTYGAGDGGSTFNLPDLRGIFVRGSGAQTLFPRKTVTITQANPAVVTWDNHGLPANTAIVFSTTGALPTGITAGTTYYVRSTGLTADTFQISATSGGAAIATTSAGSGVHTARTTVGFSYSGDFSAIEHDTIQGHVHLSPTRAVAVNNGNNYTGIPLGNADTQNGSNTGGPVADGTNGTPRTSPETRPANIAMLYCIKF